MCGLLCYSEYMDNRGQTAIALIVNKQALISRTCYPEYIANDTISGHRDAGFGFDDSYADEAN